MQAPAMVAGACLDKTVSGHPRPCSRGIYILSLSRALSRVSSIRFRQSSRQSSRQRKGSLVRQQSDGSASSGTALEEHVRPDHDHPILRNGGDRRLQRFANVLKCLMTQIWRRRSPPYGEWGGHDKTTSERKLASESYPGRTEFQSLPGTVWIFRICRVC
jgi:hypothetical protein